MYSKEERVNQIKSECKKKGIKFLGFLNGYKNSFSKIILSCNKHGSWNTGTINGLVNSGKGCPECGGAKIFTEKERINQVLDKCKGTNYKFLGLVGVYSGTYTKLNMNCCLHGGWNSTSIHKFLNQSQGCRECGFTKISKSKAPKIGSRVNQIKARCKEKGYLFIGFSDGYKNSSSRIIIKCNDHGEWKPTIHDFVNGKFGCAGCAKTGFDDNKIAHLYCLISECNSFIKVGISNNINNRIRQLTRHTPFKFNVFNKIELDGIVARNNERSILDKFTNANLSGFDGSTEWLLYNEQIKQEINKINSCY